MASSFSNLDDASVGLVLKTLPPRDLARAACVSKRLDGLVRERPSPYFVGGLPIRPEDGFISSATVSKCGTMLAAIFEHGSITVWSLLDGTRLHAFEKTPSWSHQFHPSGPLNGDLQFGEDRRLILSNFVHIRPQTAESAPHLFSWDLSGDDGEPNVTSIGVNVREVPCFLRTYLRSGSVIVGVAFESGLLELYEAPFPLGGAAPAPLIASIRPRGETSVQHFEFSRDGSKLAACTSLYMGHRVALPFTNNTVEVYDLTTNGLLFSLSIGGQTASHAAILCWSFDSSRLIVNFCNNNVRVCDVVTRSFTAERLGDLHSATWEREGRLQIRKAGCELALCNYEGNVYRVLGWYASENLTPTHAIMLPDRLSARTRSCVTFRVWYANSGLHVRPMNIP